jgi:hypothetical protein
MYTVARLKIPEINGTQLLGATRQDNAEIPLASLCTVNQ